MLNGMQLLCAIALMTLATQITRFLPFIVFGRGKKPSPMMLYLGRALPPAMLALLVVYCLKQVRPAVYPYGIPELVGCALTACLYLWKKNSLPAIFGGAAVYMLLVQAVFV